ncbi:CCN family member 2-like [Latimeria chalumnae]|uniref:CCN family member 2-like n=1 Tax=Latimeria chalumnae TaxID=7897 RepID=UPI0003C1B0D6|nr:PREDICTED: connective tissue growth factor-like [Latimeria chalumnae]|eukprot:XP_006005438.1 PREDICTED: connective tissue growth factor-like [Latimeria chalumnae]
MSPAFAKTLLSSFFIPLIWGWVKAEDCPFPCRCSSRPVHCSLGTSLILDSCGCCMVCAAQLGDPCSRLAPCDHHKGLYCDRSSEVSGNAGICLAHEGATCDLGGVVYRTGERFQPSCKYQCTCMDGAIGCVPLCSDDVRLPSPNCPFPHRVKIPGQCCEQWICDQSSKENRFESAMTIYRVVPAYSPDLNSDQRNCIAQTTDWSACSASCGMGLSTRITNDNKECRLEKQRRLCMVRPCYLQLEKIIKRGRKCVRTPKPLKGMRFKFSGCTSVRMYRPKFCGVCTDSRCCTPHTTATLDVKFACPDGDPFIRKMMFIKTCSCHEDCPQDNDIFQATQRRNLIGDCAA